jgi:hypothetical protein
VPGHGFRLTAERRRLPQQAEAHRVALCCQPPRRDETVTAIVSRAAEHRNARRRVDEPRYGIGDRRSRALHEALARDAGSHCRAIARLHLDRDEEFNHWLCLFVVHRA